MVDFTGRQLVRSVPGLFLAAGFLFLSGCGDADPEGKPVAARKQKDPLQQEQDRKAAFKSEIVQGQNALFSRRYEDAVDHFRAALKLYPEDAEAKQLLADAVEGTRGGPVRTPAPPAVDPGKPPVAPGQPAVDPGKPAPDPMASVDPGKPAPDPGKGSTEPGMAMTDPPPGNPVTAIKPSPFPGSGARMAPVSAGQADTSQVIAQAKALMAAGRYMDALLTYDQALQSAPNDPNLLQARAEALNQLNNDMGMRNLFAAYQQYMAAGQNFMLAQRYGDAVGAYWQALRLVPGDYFASQAIREAEARLARLQKLELRRGEYNRLMVLAAAALRGQVYAEAVNDYQLALKLFPGDAEAQRGLNFVSLLAKGKEAMVGRYFAQAIQAFNDALTLIPGDPAATQLLADAQAGTVKMKDYEKYMGNGDRLLQQRQFFPAATQYQNALKVFPGDDLASRKLKEATGGMSAMNSAIQADFKRLMQQGTNEVKTRQFDKAIKTFRDAQKLIPNDPAAKQAEAEATRGRDARMAFLTNLNKGKAALQAQNFDEAAREFTVALQLAPGDLDATKGLKEAQAGQTSRGSYNRYINDGKRALAGKDFRGAERAYGEALKLFPGDLTAKAGIQEAQIAARKYAKTIYDRMMRQGEQAFLNKRYDESIRSYREALRAMPNDATAMVKIQKVEELKQQSAKNAVYDKHMKAARAAVKAKRYSDAITEYNAALKERPGDADATQELQAVTKEQDNPKKDNTKKDPPKKDKDKKKEKKKDK